MKLSHRKYEQRALDSFLSRSQGEAPGYSGRTADVEPWAPEF